MRNSIHCAAAAALLLTAGAERSSAFDNRNPAWSPDARLVAYYSDAGGREEIYLYDLEKESIRRLTNFDRRKSFSAAWSADGETLVFYSGRGGKFEAFAQPIEGPGTAEKLTELGVYVSNPSISPDGEHLVFSANLQDPNEHEIYRMELATGELTQLTDNEVSDWSPVWSPDGCRIAFVSDRRVRFDFDVYVMAGDGGEPIAMPDRYVHEYYPDWSPDGRELLFFAGPDRRRFDLYAVEVASGELRRITEGARAGRGSWSPDGKQVVFSAPGEDGDRLYVVPAGGGEPKLLPGQ